MPEREYLIQRLLQLANDCRSEAPCCLSSFELMEQLGSGGTSTVFSARRKSDGQHCVLKMMKDGYTDTWHNNLAAFATEISVRAFIDSEFLINHFGVGAHDLRAFIVRESAGRMVEQIGRIRENEVELHRQFVRYYSAIRDLHKSGFVAVDVVPSNFLYTNRGVVFGDLGSVRRYRSNTSGFRLLHDFFEEVFASDRELRKRQISLVPTYLVNRDIAGLGLVFYELLTDTKLSGAESFPHVESFEISLPSEVRPEWGTKYDNLIVEMVSIMHSASLTAGSAVDRIVASTLEEIT